MEQGEKIAALRKRKGMTQAELGAALNVTYQAVSKWERGESYPNFDTVTQLAKLFDVSINYFANDYDGAETETASAKEEAAETAEAEQTDSREMLGVCKNCGNVVYKGNEAQTLPHLLCKKCKEREQLAAKRKAEAERQQREDAERAVINARNDAIAATKRKRNRGFIIAGIITAVLFVIGVIVNHTAVAIGENLLGSLFIFTFIAQMIWGGTVREVCLKGGVIIGTPGVIFSLDLDGLAFLIIVKVLFAVLRMIVFLVFLLFFVAVAIIISPFTFVPGIIKLSRGIDPDDDI